MGALSDWVRQVVMVLVLTGVVELALPTGALRRYVQVVLGLLVLLAIVRPVLAWLGSEPATLVPAWQQVLEGMSAGPGRAGGPAGTVGPQDLQAARDRTRSLALDLHRQRLVALIRDEVRAVVGTEPLAIDLDLVTDPGSPRWGAVTGLTVHLPARRPAPAPGGFPPGASPDPSSGPAAPGDSAPDQGPPGPGSAVRPVEPVRIPPVVPSGSSGPPAPGGAPQGRGGLPAGPDLASGGGPLPAAERRALAQRLQQALASRLGLDPAAVGVVWVEAVEGGDGGGPG
ncbi:stage III sporulation protein AF [Thermaerobacter subterraneus]|uniref:Stage III sporulation protein, SpoIIIAF family n=1 Tax=Thermaerobacter subterraneus DSM 13965 TaxID=867903 RepID=K6PYK8_9FIRM|nr:stage III sporulation protein AF [Thermaerobacter subterraneus]EKP93823.1 stage III sporulation protein, SpoIIIAF family [Thermaerobacter subterraneus DSM 13965]